MSASAGISPVSCEVGGGLNLSCTFSEIPISFIIHSLLGTGKNDPSDVSMSLL